MTVAPLASIPVGVVAERRKAKSAWIDHVWRPLAVLDGIPAAAPWTMLSQDEDVATFFVGTTTIDLYRSETGHYRDNLASGTPQIWLVLRPCEGEHPYELFLATADPAEGEGYTETGTDLVEPVPMPEAIRAAIEDFVAEHHVERPFFKRKRDRANPDALGRRGPAREDER
ncbi:MAG: DUF3305 domain-containing protein [Xanthobacteraceae bacterium]|nr:DUF3305 domain-containing protein [Burkholderiales bacterium]MCZ7658095.1 DUF3305 domain-containing protein [Xanthobacteraceae bacterium]PWB59448.1 MAG: DUF3305 domain-containing protein [Bradyrhizobiaceae bacterium]